MASKHPIPTPARCILYRSSRNDEWKLDSISLSLSESVAVSGYNFNTCQTFIDVHRRNSDPRENPRPFYSRQFETSNTYEIRLVSFFDHESEELVTGCNSELEIISPRYGSTLSCRRVDGKVKCLSVRRKHIFVGFQEARIIVFNRKLDTTKSIPLNRIRKQYLPIDMAVTAERVYINTSNNKVVALEKEKKSKIIELESKSGQNFLARSVAVSMHFGVVSVLWGNGLIEFYPVSERKSFFTINSEDNISSIRISENGKLATGNWNTGEVKLHDLAEFITYHQLKENLVSAVRKEDCLRLANFFAVTKDLTGANIRSETSMEDFLLKLEEKGVVKPSNVDKLSEAFHLLEINSCYLLIEFYKKLIMQPTPYERFLAILSTHLTKHLPERLCDHFHILGKKKRSILSSQTPGISVLLALHEKQVINSSNVAALGETLHEFKLVQAVAKTHEYQSTVDELTQPVVEVGGKKEQFIRLLQKKISSWYEAMTPVPWNKSCRWKSAELFVGSGLILTDSKAKKSLIDIDEQCKLQYTEIFTHERLKSETRLVLEGDPGSGKTMLASQLAYDWSQGKISEIDILILLPLKFVGDKTLIESIWEWYIPESIDLSVVDLERSIEDEGSKCCFLLDGLEEYNGKGGEPSEVMKVMKKCKYPNSKVIITSRSDFAQDLPSCPMLKLGRFSERERSTYIEKVFPGDEDKQWEVRNIIENNPFILDLCSVPLLFVLSVHNIDTMGQTQEQHQEKVTPFVTSMVKTLGPSFMSHTGTNAGVIENEAQGKVSLYQIAFNGLCRGHQQLSWEKDFVESNVVDSNDWLDSGILIVMDDNEIMGETEDGIFPVRNKLETDSSDIKDLSSVPGTTLKGKFSSTREKNNSNQNIFQNTREWPDLSSPTTEIDKQSFSLQPDFNTACESHAESDKGVREVFGTIGAGELESADSSIGKRVSLQVKFVHKIIQEWFAAKHIVHMTYALNNVEDQKTYLEEILPFINPADLHYVLRFLCGLYPDCAHFIIENVLTNYRLNDRDLPEYIINCAIHCFSEYGGDPERNILQAVKMIGNRNITINCEDSRLLQQAKVSLMKLASDLGISIQKATLAGVVTSATQDVLMLKSGISLGLIHTLQEIEMHGWDNSLSSEDCNNIVVYVMNCSLLGKAKLTFPQPPPTLNEETLKKFIDDRRTLSVTWSIGSIRSLLNKSSGEWLLREPDVYKSETLGTEDIGVRSTISSLQNTRKTSSATPFKQKTLKQQTRKGQNKSANTEGCSDLEALSASSPVISDGSSCKGAGKKAGNTELQDRIPSAKQHPHLQVLSAYDPNLQQVFVDISGKVGTEWKMLGRRLGLTSAEIYQNCDAKDICCREKVYVMLEYWQQKNSSKAKVDDLITALRNENRNDLADSILEAIEIAADSSP